MIYFLFRLWLSLCFWSLLCFSMRLALFFPRTALLAITIIIGLLRAFSRFVVLLRLVLLFFPLDDPNFSRPSRPSRIDAMRSSYVAFAFLRGPRISASPSTTASSPASIVLWPFVKVPRFLLEDDPPAVLARRSFRRAKSAGVRI